MKKSGFTLAEILISLMILGVIAALTIPSLINNINEKHLRSAWKTAFSEIAQAQKMLNIDYDNNFYSQCDSFDNSCLGEIFQKRLSSTRLCYQYEENCQADSTFKDGTTNAFTNINAMDLPILYSNKGYSVKFRMHNQNCAPFGNEDNPECGWAQVDVNGVMPPNVAGKDIFFVLFYPDHVKAFPSYNDAQTKSNDEIEEECNSGAGTYCSALYLTE